MLIITARRHALAAFALLVLFPASGLAAKRPATSPATTYHDYCSVCHGESGDGRSRARASLVPPPRDFTDRAHAARLTREYMIAIVLDGKPGTAMVGWRTQLGIAETEALVDYIRDTFLKPALDSALARGRNIYARSCAACHGNRGQGSAGNGVQPGRPVGAFRAAAGAAQRGRMIAAVMDQPHGAAAARTSIRLAQDDAVAVVDYVRTALMNDERAPSQSSAVVAEPPAARTGTPHAAAVNAPATGVDMSLPLPRGLLGDARRGARFYAANCATCHGISGDGRGPRAYFIRPSPRNFLAPAARASLNRPALFAAVSEGSRGAEMPAWNKVLTDQQIADVSEHVFRAYIAPAGSAHVSSRAP